MGSSVLVAEIGHEGDEGKALSEKRDKKGCSRWKKMSEFLVL